MALTPEKKRQLDEIYAREGVEGIQKLRASLEEEEEKPGFLKQLGQFAIKGAVEGTKLAEFIGRSIPGGGKDKWDPQRHERLPGLLQKTTYSPEEIERRMGGATATERFVSGAKVGSKGAAGVASYLVPFAAPVVAGPSAVSTIAPQASDMLLKMLNFGVAGGVQAGTREYLEEETTPGRVAGQAGVGALTAAATVPAGEALKATGKFVGKKLGAVGEKLSKYNIVKKFGKPKKNLGGTTLIDQMDEVGIKTGSVEQMSDGAEELLKISNDTIRPGLGNIGDDVVSANKNQIISSLDDTISKTKSIELRGPLEKVRTRIIEDLKGIQTAEDFYKLKQEYGVAAHWSIKRDISESEANAYRLGYMKMNSLIDGWLKDTGEESFMQMNRNSHISIKVLSYLDDVAQKEGARAPIGLFDVLSFVWGWGAGGPVGAFKSYVAKKLLLSPTAFKLYGGVAKTAGGVVGGTAETAGAGIQSAVGRGGVTSLSQFLTGGR